MIPYNRLYALVQEIEANTGRIDQAASRALRDVVHHEIPGLGTVTVTSAGPVAIDLDRRALQGTRGASLGAAVTRAIVAAEAEFRRRYEEAMADARRDITA